MAGRSLQTYAEKPKLVPAIVASAPAGPSEPLYVRIPAFGNALSEVKAWPEENGLPSVGDEGLVAIDLNGEPWLVAWTRSAPRLVSALPTSPRDTQEVYFLADATAGIVWHLRYRAASASAHKWEFIGGSRISTPISGSIETTALETAPVAMTGGPTITPPLNGEYEVTVSAFMTLQVAGAENLNTFLVPTGEEANILLIFVATAQFSGAWLEKTRVLSLGAGKPCALYVGSSGGLKAAYQDGDIAYRPVRVG